MLLMLSCKSSRAWRRAAGRAPLLPWQLTSRCGGSAGLVGGVGGLYPRRMPLCHWRGDGGCRARFNAPSIWCAANIVDPRCLPSSSSVLCRSRGAAARPFSITLASGALPPAPPTLARPPATFAAIPKLCCARWQLWSKSWSSRQQQQQQHRAAVPVRGRLTAVEGRGRRARMMRSQSQQTPSLRHALWSSAQHRHRSGQRQLEQWRQQRRQQQRGHQAASGCHALRRRCMLLPGCRLRRRQAGQQALQRQLRRQRCHSMAACLQPPRQGGRRCARCCPTA